MSAGTADRVVLGAAGLVLIAVGAGSAVVPEAFYADYGIDVSTTELAGEMRAAGMALLLLGVLVGSGAVWRRVQLPAAVLAAVVLLGYATGRSVSALLDGTPQASVVAAGATELVLGAAAAWVAVRTLSGSP